MINFVVVFTLIYRRHLTLLIMIFLLYKLYHYGVRGVAHDWFRDYLTSRQQFTSLGGINSSFAKLACGVPQGSVLGPLLFLIYV